MARLDLDNPGQRRCDHGRQRCADAPDADDAHTRRALRVKEDERRRRVGLRIERVVRVHLRYPQDDRRRQHRRVEGRERGTGRVLIAGSEPCTRGGHRRGAQAVQPWIREIAIRTDRVGDGGFELADFDQPGQRRCTGRQAPQFGGGVDAPSFVPIHHHDRKAPKNRA